MGNVDKSLCEALLAIWSCTRLLRQLVCLLTRSARGIWFPKFINQHGDSFPEDEGTAEELKKPVSEVYVFSHCGTNDLCHLPLLPAPSWVLGKMGFQKSSLGNPGRKEKCGKENKVKSAKEMWDNSCLPALRKPVVVGGAELVCWKTWQSVRVLSHGGNLG